VRQAHLYRFYNHPEVEIIEIITLTQVVGILYFSDLSHTVAERSHAMDNIMINRVL